MQRFFFLLLGFVGLTSSLAYAQTNASKGSVDALINWQNPLDLTPAKFTAVAEALPRKKSEVAYNTKKTGAGTEIYAIGPGTVLGTSGGGKTNLFDGGIQVDSVTAVFNADRLISIEFALGVAYGMHNRKPSAKDLEKFKAELAKATGDKAPQPFDVKVGPGNPPRSGLQWAHSAYKVLMFELAAVAPNGREEVRKGLYTIKIVPHAPQS